MQGIVASGFAFPLMSWCLRKRGPLYVAMFGPLIIVFVAVLSSIFLDETLHLGMCVLRDACALLACLLLCLAFTLLLSPLQRARHGPDSGWAVHGALGQSERSTGERSCCTCSCCAHG